MQIKNTGFYSKKLGNLADGCKYCVKGEKLVLFVTGICPRKCYFCPLSDDKYSKDVIYANEKKIDKETEVDKIIKEAELCESAGAGITGGDPLARLNRTVRFIKSLKDKFQTKKKIFHIHLYTSLDLVSNESLRELYMAGLDEIRFHPDLDDNKYWDRINLAIKYNWKIGIEVPVIPGKGTELKKLIEFVEEKVNFINLNELEMADNKVSRLSDMGFKTKNKTSYAVKGSDKLAKELLSYVSENNIKLDVHFCTAKLKDKVQLAKRIMRRAENIRQEFDVVDPEGMLIRGVIYPKGLEPGFGYQKKIKAMKNQKTLESLKKTEENLKKDFKIKDKMIARDENKLRILTSVKIAKKLSKKIKNRCAIVTEYPTEDSFEVEIDFLN
ncbi:MAG: radical SAM protein [Candidatus Woesearchaeota archaeon]